MYVFLFAPTPPIFLSMVSLFHFIYKKVDKYI